MRFVVSTTRAFGPDCVSANHSAAVQALFDRRKKLLAGEWLGQRLGHAQAPRRVLRGGDIAPEPARDRKNGSAVAGAEFPQRGIGPRGVRDIRDHQREAVRLQIVLCDEIARLSQPAHKQLTDEVIRFDDQEPVPGHGCRARRRAFIKLSRDHCIPSGAQECVDGVLLFINGHKRMDRQSRISKAMSRISKNGADARRILAAWALGPTTNGDKR